VVQEFQPVARVKEFQPGKSDHPEWQTRPLGFPEEYRSSRTVVQAVGTEIGVFC
jgi:hypothetical protein